MSNWSAQHFNKIAKVIRDKRDYSHYFADESKARDELLNELTLEFAKFFEKENSRFDTNKFVTACGYELPPKG